MYRSYVQHTIHCTVCTDLMYNTLYTVQYVQIMGAGYNGTAGDRPLSFRNHYLLYQMKTKGDMFYCIYSVYA